MDEFGPKGCRGIVEGPGQALGGRSYKEERNSDQHVKVFINSASYTHIDDVWDVWMDM